MLDALLPGLWITLAATALAIALLLVVAVIIGPALLSPRRLVRVGARIYVEFFRGVPPLVQMYFLFFVLPAAGVVLSPMAAGVLGLGLHAGSYGAEIVRGAIQSVPRAQHEAGIVLGLSPATRLRRVTMPQAVVLALPPMGTLFMDVLKGSSLVSLVTLSDLTLRGQQYIATQGDPLAVYGTLLGIYFVLCSLIARGTRAAEKRARFDVLPKRRVRSERA